LIFNVPARVRTSCCFPGRAHPCVGFAQSVEPALRRSKPMELLITAALNERHAKRPTFSSRCPPRLSKTVSTYLHGKRRSHFLSPFLFVAVVGGRSHPLHTRAWSFSLRTRALPERGRCRSVFSASFCGRAPAAQALRLALQQGTIPLRTTHTIPSGNTSPHTGNSINRTANPRRKTQPRGGFVFGSNDFMLDLVTFART